MATCLALWTALQATCILKALPVQFVSCGLQIIITIVIIIIVIIIIIIIIIMIIWSSSLL